ncbi:MAG TPA: protein translocase subunit SecD [Pyrinomonadaceae bacterium]|jgi:preprotein translocase subunit SecD
MKKNLLQRFIIILVVTLVGLWVVLGPRHRPTLADFTPAGVNKTLRENINLGLDLRGGSHLVMQVQVQDYLKRLTTETAVSIQNAARDAGYDLKEVRPEVGDGTYRVVLVANDPSKISEIRDSLPTRANGFDPSIWTASASGNTLTWEMSDRAETDLGTRATQDAMKIIDSRINALGVTEPTLQQHGAASAHQILLQMPGITDPERLKATLRSEARLELVHVLSNPAGGGWQSFPTEEAAKASLGGTVPQNRRVLPYVERGETTAATAPDAQPSQWVVVETPPVIDGSELREARSEGGDLGGDGAHQIGFTLKPSGAEKFGRWTGANVGQFMGVVLDEKVKSIATIQSQITDSGRITGSFTKEQAEDLALTLRSGALPAKVVYLEERTVGPSLGQDSIRAGVTASLIGLGLVILTMVVYYRWSGINAVVALLLNTLLTLAALIIFKATLTLPGIAGVLLGIGMAVDSNVLIFERIREELQSGKTVPSAIDAGFDRAFVTIIDTHVTTIVSSLFLFVFGTTLIRGFAVTLVLGLLANLFTAVYVSRTIFMWELSRKQGRVETLSI